MGAVVGFWPWSTAARRAVERRFRAGPVRILRRQGCRLELLGVCWARVRASLRRGRGTGVGRKERVECRACIKDVRVVEHSVVDGSLLESLTPFVVSTSWSVG